MSYMCTENSGPLPYTMSSQLQRLIILGYEHIWKDKA